jgi:putative ABC transport system permease protein
MRTILQDLRYCLRQLVRMPGFTFTAVISLALGIGATTAVFSVVYAILADPYPYANSDRMIHMRLLQPNGDRRGFGVTGAQWQQLRKSPVVEDSFMEDDWRLTVTGSDLPEDVQGAYLTSNAFNFLGVPAAVGRGLQPSDAIDGQDPQPVVVLGYKFWQRHFHGDPGVVGQTMQLVRNTYTIVGVAGSRFTWGDGDVYLPLKVTGDTVKSFYAGIRLKPGLTHEQADAALQPLIQQFAKETPRNFPQDFSKLRVEGLNERFIKELGGTPVADGIAAALLDGRHARAASCLQNRIGHRGESPPVFVSARGRHPDQSAGAPVLYGSRRGNRHPFRPLSGLAALASRGQPGDAIQFT